MNLTKPQKLIYDMEKFAGEAIAVICGSMLVNGKRSLDEIKSAVNEMYRLNDALRIRISKTDGQVSQIVSEYTEQDFHVLCLKNKSELDMYAEKYAAEPLDFYSNLCEINIVTLPEQYGLLVKMHHMIGDAWSLSLLGTQFNKLMNGEAVKTYSYIDYIENENVYIQSKRYEKDKKFFLEQFKKCDEITYLSEKQSDSLNACRKSFVIDAEKTRLINEYVQKNNTSVFMLFAASLSAYMNRIKMNAEKFYIGTAVLNRSGVKENNTTGMFVNTAPMLIELNNSKSFVENLSSIESTAFSVFRHQKYNYGDVLAAIRKEYSFTERLYDVLISYQNATVSGADIETTWYHSGSQNESLQIHIDDRDQEGIFRIHYDYQTDKFTGNEIAKIHSYICNLLLDAIADDKKKLYELNLLSADEKQKLLFEFNDTAVDYAKDKCIHQLFEEQVKKTPDKAAIIAGDKTLTYAELNTQANHIAHALIEKGVGVGDLVVYTLTRKSYLISTILGILKTGAAYVPVTPDYPQDRIMFMCADCNAQYFITEANIEELLSCDCSYNPNVPVSPDDLCYCIYTSGSTGKPKGVMLRHRNVTNYVSENHYNVLNINFTHSQNAIAAITTCGFDIFVTESLLPLVNGFTVILADEVQSKNPQAFNTLMKNHPADVIQTTPTKLKMLLADKNNVEYLDKIESIILGGEALEESFLHELRKMTNAHIYNNYGPTETTVWSTLTEIVSDDITIGKPIANTQIYIVDQYMQLTPIGVTGELCIAGDGVGAGYLNRPELTAEKFIDNPFGEGKLYKTGDLAYWREDGNIVYIGRNDFQVKIRGLRIELGEIENIICSIDDITQAVVVVRKNNEGRQFICAFYSGTELDIKVIRSYIGKKLPKYMQPHIFSYLEEIPMTTSGKVNRKALPEVDLDNIRNDAEYVSPETQMQKELCKLMESALGTNRVGITDDFFDLGGDSLKAIEFVSKAHGKGIFFDLQNVFDHPTVRELCECMEEMDKQEISFDDVDFTEIDKLLEKNKTENLSVPQKNEVGNILLAGATGYLGIHILAEFLDKDKGIAYCLVRGNGKEESIYRLQKLLCFYFGEKYANMQRIEVICSDLQKDKFGLTEKEYSTLLGKVDTVINCAASVKHYGSYSYFYEANVETVKRLITFCKMAGAKLIHTSTMSVSGNSFGEEFGNHITFENKDFTESNLYIGQPLDNVYARSKFEAEKVVLDAMADGLQANIMRMGQLTNRLSDGVFQKNYESNAFLKRLKAMLDLGIVPYNLKTQYTEFTPIDKAANAVMTIVRNFTNEYTVFHIENHKFVYMEELVNMFNQLNYHVKFVSEAAFSKIIDEISGESDKSHILETFINELDDKNRLSYESNIQIKFDFTIQYLKRLGFEWPKIGMDYLRKYVEYFRRIGYFK